MKTCDLCKAENLDEYVDGKTIYGPWAFMCLFCFAEVGVGLGLGRGQLYKWNGQKYEKKGG